MSPLSILQRILVIRSRVFVMDVSRATHVPYTRGTRNDNRTQFASLHFAHTFQLFLPRRIRSRILFFRVRGDGRRESVSHLTIFNFSRAWSSYVHSLARPPTCSLARSFARNFPRAREALNFSFHLERSHIRGFHPLEQRGPFNCYPCYSQSRVFPIRIPRLPRCTETSRSKETGSRTLTSASWISFDYRIFRWGIFFIGS